MFSKVLHYMELMVTKQSAQMLQNRFRIRSSQSVRFATYNFSPGSWPNVAMVRDLANAADREKAKIGVFH